MVSSGQCWTRCGVIPCIFVLLCISSMAQPSVTLKGLDADGVSLAPSTGPGVGSGLDRGRDTSLDVLLPYAPLIKNETDRHIIAYSAHWECTDTTGRVGRNKVAIYDFSAFPSRTDLPPGGAWLVSTIPGLGSPTLRYSDISDQVNHLMSLFMRQRTIVISLDAVLFDDGTAVGPDPDHWISKWKAQIDAERDVYGALAAATSASIDGELKVWSAIATERARPLSNDPVIGIPQLQQAAIHANTYDEAYLYMRGLFSVRLQNMIKTRGEAAAVAAVRDFVRNKHYPRIHREE
jgi:hypothetical protein